MDLHCTSFPLCVGYGSMVLENGLSLEVMAVGRSQNEGNLLDHLDSS